MWDSMKSLMEPYTCKAMILAKKVGIGSLRKKVHELSTSSKHYIFKCWVELGLLTNNNNDNLTDICTSLRSIVWKVEVYRPEDHVIVLTNSTISPTNGMHELEILHKNSFHT